MSGSERSLGVGIGWREELAGFIAQVDDLRFVEAVAEAIDPARGAATLLRHCERVGFR